MLLGEPLIGFRTTSGDVGLALAPSSSFELHFVSHSGDLDDRLGVSVLDAEHGKHGAGQVRARIGKAEGLVECQTFSGDLDLRKR